MLSTRGDEEAGGKDNGAPGMRRTITSINTGLRVAITDGHTSRGDATRDEGLSGETVVTEN